MFHLKEHQNQNRSELFRIGLRVSEQFFVRAGQSWSERSK